MNPDTEHKRYYKKNPIGNHDSPSRETLKMFADLERRMEDKIDSDVEVLNTKLESKMEKEMFIWIVGVIVSMMLGLFGVIYAKMEKIDEKTGNTQSSVSRIEGQLLNAEIIN
jgi:hypothetical protein